MLSPLRRQSSAPRAGRGRHPGSARASPSQGAAQMRICDRQLNSWPLTIRIHSGRVRGSGQKRAPLSASAASAGAGEAARGSSPRPGGALRRASAAAPRSISRRRMSLMLDMAVSRTAQAKARHHNPVMRQITHGATRKFLYADIMSCGAEKSRFTGLEENGGASENTAWRGRAKRTILGGKRTDPLSAYHPVPGLGTPDPS